MAKIVGGFGSSHSPLMSLPSHLWSVHAQNDIRNGELVTMPAGNRVTYDELVAQALARAQRRMLRASQMRPFG